MDCSRLSANIAAATCRTGRIDVRELMLVNWGDWQKYQRGFDSSWAGRLVADTRAGSGRYRTAGVPALVGDTFTFYAIKPEGTVAETYRLSLWRKTKRSTSGYQVIFDAQAQAWDTPATYTVRADYESEDGMYYVTVDRAGLTAVIELEGQTVPPLFSLLKGAASDVTFGLLSEETSASVRANDYYSLSYARITEAITLRAGDTIEAITTFAGCIFENVGGSYEAVTPIGVQFGDVYKNTLTADRAMTVYVGSSTSHTQVSYYVAPFQLGLTTDEVNGSTNEPFVGETFSYRGRAVSIKAGSTVAFRASTLPSGAVCGLLVEKGAQTAEVTGARSYSLYNAESDCVIYIASDVEGQAMDCYVSQMTGGTGDMLILSLSDGINYPPVVSLLATHERGIVSFAEEVKGAYLNGYAHRIQFTAFDRKQSVKDVLNILGRGRFVALARYEQDGEDVVVVYGADCGMVAEAETFDSSNTDGEIGQAVLATDEGCMESLPMLTLEPSGSLATVADAWAWLKGHAFG